MSWNEIVGSERIIVEEEEKQQSVLQRHIGGWRDVPCDILSWVPPNTGRWAYLLELLGVLRTRWLFDIKLLLQ